jgi:serine-type D-Ala-D-Ala carboxypeptidase/endopeptidase (penicillin-binding protein 4)
MTGALAACVPALAGPRAAQDERQELRRTIDSLLAAPDARHARWGVLVVDPAAGDTLYSRDAGKLFVPASNQKILTAAIALDALGPDFRFRTPFVARGELRDGVLAGDLLVVGRGDPTVSDHLAGDAMIPLRLVADSLWQRGVRRVRGRVMPFGNAFPDANAGFGWSWEDFEFSYGAMVDELLFNEGFSEIRVRAGSRPGEAPAAATLPARTFPRVRVEAVTTLRGSGRDSTAQLDAAKDTARGEIVVTGTIPAGDSARLEVTHRDPAEAYVAAFREALQDRGITIGDSATPPVARPDTLVVLESPPLSQILGYFMKPSQNQIGEMLFKAVALQRTDTGAARIARRIAGERLRAWGAERDGFLVYDGSGLSRRDYVSPETLARVLDAMRRGPHFQVFFDAMPVAGVDGTLRGRMRGTRAEANVRGKTGTLGNVRSLSGYVTTATGRLLIFSVLCNNYLVSTDYVSRVQDTIAVRLSRLRGLREGISGDAVAAGGGR